MSDIATLLLALDDVHAFYGSAHILEGVTFSMGVEAVALIGRNGMGKSTLCNTIMGLCRGRAGRSAQPAGGGADACCPSSRVRSWATSRREAGCSRRFPWTST